MFTSIDNLFMIIPNNCLFKKEFWSSNMPISKELKEYQPLSGQRSFPLSIILKGQSKFWELVTQLRKL